MKYENTLSQADSILCLLNQHSCFLMICFTVFLPSMFRTLEWSFYLTFPHMCHSPSISSFWFDYAMSIQYESGWHIIKILFMPLSCKHL